ncbi:MAG: hypothetical protein J1F28_02945 [Oscillospiraceae bacterium]|nr:hypothetical protein [Oscillospiraceae bacterium]
MIPEKYIDAYRSIKAPETLHDRVTASSASPVRRTRALLKLIAAGASLAASFAVITVAVIAFNMSRSDIGAYIAYNGQPVETSVAITMNEVSQIKAFGIGMSDYGGIRLEVHTTGTATVTVSSGTLTLVDEYGTATDSGSLLTLSDDKDSHTVYWQADFYEVIEGEPFSLVIAEEHGSVTYTLTDSNGELTLTKNSKN